MEVSVLSRELIGLLNKGFGTGVGSGNELVFWRGVSSLTRMRTSMGHGGVDEGRNKADAVSGEWPGGGGGACGGVKAEGRDRSDTGVGVGTGETVAAGASLGRAAMSAGGLPLGSSAQVLSVSIGG